MSNIRVNKIALELNVQNDQVIEELQKQNIMVKNYMSAIDEEAADYIRTVFSKSPKSKTKKVLSSSKPKKIIKATSVKTKSKTQKNGVKKIF